MSVALARIELVNVVAGAASAAAPAMWFMKCRRLMPDGTSNKRDITGLPGERWKDGMVLKG
jgi:hypothetical protein